MRLSPLSWTLLTVLLYALGSNLDWMLRSAPRASTPSLAPLQAQLQNPETRHRLRLLFLLGLPALALLLRIPPPAAIGLPIPGPESGLAPWTWQAAGDAPWPRDFLTTIGLALATAALLLAADSWQAAADGRRRGRIAAVWPRVAAVGPAALDALALQAHWALLRAGLVSLGLDRPGLVMFLALGLIGLEAWSNPWLRARANDPPELARVSQTAVLGILSGLVFLQTGSSLWALCAHLLVVLALLSLQPGAWLGAGGSRSPAAGGQPALGGAEPRGLPRREAEPIEPTVV